MINPMLYGISQSIANENLYGISMPYCLEAKILFAKWASLGVPASEVRKRLVNNIIIELKENKIWDFLDCLYIWTAHAKLAALVDWKNPNTRSARIILDYAGSFVTDGYFQSNGSCIIDTNFNPGDGGQYNFTRISNSFGNYRMRHDSNVNLIDLSSFNTSTNTGFEIFYLTNGSALNISNASNTYYSNQFCTEAGLAGSSRNSNNNFELKHNGYILPGNSVIPSFQVAIAATIPNTSFVIGGRSNGGVYSLKSTGRHGFTFFGGYQINQWLLQDIINRNLFVPLGVNLNTRITILGNSMTSNATNYVPRTIANLGYNFVINWAGVPGYTLAQCKALATRAIMPFRTTAYSKDIVVITELTNTMAGNGSDITVTYNELLDLCLSLRIDGKKIVVTTMLPRNSAQVNNTLRQNDSNLTDPTTLNGMIRNTSLGLYWDAIADWGSDPIMGIYSNGTSGVGEKNTTYYTVDMIHPTTTGYNLLADTYVSPAITSLL